MPALLSAKSAEYLIALSFDHVIFDPGPFRAPLRPGLYVNIRHILFSFRCLQQEPVIAPAERLVDAGSTHFVHIELNALFDLYLRDT
jgi:hypothetical protein